MPSQLDLDQGGYARQTQRIYLGPSIGWVNAPAGTIIPVTAAGTFVLLPGTGIVTVNVNGLVTIQLPSAKGNAAGAGAVPGSFVQQQLLIIDIGGFANANNITINPAAGETISGLTTASITNNYGSLLLNPNISAGGWD